MPKTTIAHITGYRDTEKDIIKIYVNGERLTPTRSLKVVNHSPTGFSWGYLGSGCAQLALAILLKFADIETAKRNYQRFKEDHIAVIPFNINQFDITVDMERYTA